jgi:DNA repair ATPase RecN
VTKEVRGGRTHTNILPLAGDARVPELAAMMAGDPGSEEARADARALLRGARGEPRKRARGAKGAR